MVDVPARLQAVAAKRIGVNPSLAASEPPHVVIPAIDRVVGQVNQADQPFFLQRVALVFECVKFNFIGHVFVSVCCAAPSPLWLKPKGRLGIH